MNGGPGCTSLKGGFEELGQLVFNRHSFTENKTLAPKMYYNPVGWTRKSTMLYFESPPGVGFSYCDVCVGNATCKCVATDVSTAEDNYDALVSFFNNFPVRLVAFHPPLHSCGAQLARDRALAHEADRPVFWRRSSRTVSSTSPANRMRGSTSRRSWIRFALRGE